MGLAPFLYKITHIALSLDLSIPVGLSLYGAALLTLRVIEPQNLVILKRMRSSLPPALRGSYAVPISLAERMVGTNRFP